MKKHNVFYLWVVEKNEHKFICERGYDNCFREVLTKEEFVLEEKDKFHSLTKHYSILEVATYKNGQILNPLMLTKKDILLKYIEINEKVVSKNFDMDDLLKRQQEELEGLKILAKECPELAKKYSLEKLQGAGILDENGELTGPYKEIVVKKPKVFPVWKDNPDAKDEPSSAMLVYETEHTKQKILERKKNN